MEQSELQFTPQSYPQPVQSGLLQIDASLFFFFGLILVLIAALNRILFQPILKVIKQRERMISGKNRVARRLEDFARQREEQYQDNINVALQNSAGEVSNHIQKAENEAAQKLLKERELAMDDQQKASRRLHEEIEHLRTTGSGNVAPLAAILTDRLTMTPKAGFPGSSTGNPNGPSHRREGEGPESSSLSSSMGLILSVGLAKFFFTVFSPANSYGNWDISRLLGLNVAIAQEAGAGGAFPWFDWAAHLANFLLLSFVLGYLGFRHLRHGLVVHNRGVARDIREANQKRAQARENVRKAQHRLESELPQTRKAIEIRTIREVETESARINAQLSERIDGLKTEKLRRIAQEEKTLTEAALRDLSNSVMNSSQKMLQARITPEIHLHWVDMFIDGMKLEKPARDNKQ